VTQDELISSAESKIISAYFLAGGERYDDAIYLCGYAVEFLLKAIVCKSRNLSQYPENEKNHKTHKTDLLVDLANIRPLLEARILSDADFMLNWSISTVWSPELRYNPPAQDAKEQWEEMIEALMHPTKGVVTWLKSLL